MHRTGSPAAHWTLGLALALTPCLVTGCMGAELDLDSEETPRATDDRTDRQDHGLNAHVCGLTGADVQGVIDHYAPGTPFAEVAQAVSAPFDCARYDDLCELIGPSNAEAFICARWSEAVALLPESVVVANGEADLEVYEEDWYMTQYPDEVIPSGPGGGQFAHALTCPGVPANTAMRRYAATGSCLLTQGNGWRINTWVYNELGTSVRAFLPGPGGWVRDRSAAVEITYDFYSTNGFVRCTREMGSRTDSDGYRKRVRSRGFGYAGLAEAVSSTAQAFVPGGALASGSRQGTWNDSRC